MICEAASSGEVCGMRETPSKLEEVRIELEQQVVYDENAKQFRPDVPLKS